MHKLVWFVPEVALDATRDAVFAASAGRIGGREERVPELRVVAFELYAIVDVAP